MQGLGSLLTLLWLQLQMERFTIFVLTGKMSYFDWRALFCDNNQMDEHYPAYYMAAYHKSK